jgi:predicted ArsR family transcriptional regulator
VAANRWFRRLLAGTRGRIVAELRRGPATINELTTRLSMSPNAVRSHLAALERDDLVTLERGPPQGVGKPAHRYQLSADVHSLTPKAYDTMLDVVLTAARDSAGASGYADILHNAAARLGTNGLPANANFNTRLEHTRVLLAKIGADVDVERTGNRVRLRGVDCPLASMVCAHPELCGVLADVIARQLGVAVRECCERSAALPRCCFEAIVDAAEA